ncbi:MAG: hypothetical protein RLZZ499_315 [Cyanobacteriota bacterium]|jgi:molecular chaperone DnaK
MSANDKQRVEGMVKNLREAIQQENYDRLKSLTEELQQTMMQIGSAMYTNNDGSSSSAGTSSNSDGDEVIDADFVSQ